MQSRIHKFFTQKKKKKAAQVQVIGSLVKYNWDIKIICTWNCCIKINIAWNKSTIKSVIREDKQIMTSKIPRLLHDIHNHKQPNLVFFTNDHFHKNHASTTFYLIMQPIIPWPIPRFQPTVKSHPCLVTKNPSSFNSNSTADCVNLKPSPSLARLPNLSRSNIPSLLSLLSTPHITHVGRHSAS